MNIAVLMLNESGHGGAEKHTAELATRLRWRGHDVSLICNRRVLEAMAGMTAVEAPQVDLADFFHGNPNSFVDWKKTLRNAQFDAIVLEKGHINQGTSAFHRAARACTPFYLVIEQSRAFPPAKLGGKYLGIIPKLELWRRRIIARHRRNARYPHAIICVSDENRQAFIHDFGYPGERCQVVHNCVDTERFRPDDKAGRKLRQELNLEPGARLLAVVGRLSHQKNQSLALMAFAGILGDPGCPPDTHLLLVGDGEDEAMLREDVVQLKLGDNAIFYGRTRTPEAIMAGVDFLVLPSRHEGLPLTVAEAFACGCPAIATDAGGTREIVSSADFGWLIPNEDVVALRQAMLAALATAPGRRAAMGKACREHAVENFNADTLYGRIVDVVEQRKRGAGSRGQG